MGRASRTARVCGAVAVVAAAACTPPPTQLLTVSVGGTGSADGESWYRPVVSPDGTKVAFTSAASDLGPTDRNGTDDIYLRDLTRGTLTLVSVNATGSDSGNGASLAPAFSPDGTELVFTSSASDLGPTDPGANPDLYVRDLVAGTTRLVTVDPATGGAADASATQTYFDPHFSPDGTKVAFVTDAGNLGHSDSDRPATGFLDNEDVYVRDLAAGTTTLVSANAAGTDSGDRGSERPEFSADGRTVLFESNATNLGPGDGLRGGGEEQERDVYLRDLAAGRTTLVSVNAWGTWAGNAPSDHASFAADGTVVFESNAHDLGPPGTWCTVRDVTYQCENVYRRDLRRGTTSLVSVNTTGFWAGNAASRGPIVSPDGTKVLFISYATDLDPSAGGEKGLHIRDLTTGRTSLLRTAAGPVLSNNTWDVTFDPSGTKLVGANSQTGFGFTDTNDSDDVIVFDLVTRQVSLVSINAAGTGTGNETSNSGVFARGGQRVVFLSDSTDLVAGDDNGFRDVFLAAPHPPPAPES